MICCLLLLVVLGVFYVLEYKPTKPTEGFGMSPGTMDQLSSTHVPTYQDSVDAIIQQKLIERDLKSMTESGQDGYSPYAPA